MPDFYDMDGKSMTLKEWATSFEDGEGRRIGSDDVGEAHVSTVWLGMNHRFGDGPPLIFETMVFGGDLDGEQDRYSTREAAQDGHAAMLERVREATR